VLLDGVDAFPLLAICLAPVIIGLALAISLPNPIVSVLGRLNLIFVVAILGPSNPQNYDPQTFLLSGLFSCLATTLVLATQTLVPPLSTHRKLALLFDACRREFDTGTYWRDRRWSPEEATFFDATLIEQIVSAGGTSNSNRRELAAAMHDIGPTACRRPAAHCRSPHAVIRRINPAPCHVSVPSHQDLTSDRASIRKWKPEGKFK